MTRRKMRVIGLGGLLALVLAGAVSAETLSGTASVRERIALPEGLTFEAAIEDISRAGAPAERLAATRFQTTGQPPFAFSIDYDPAALKPQGRYSLRATLHRDGRLFATTDQVHSVLKTGSPEFVEVVMRLVSQRANQPLPAHGLRLPASFTGTLPCADCEGIRHHLDLWPDQVYALRREWLKTGEDPLRRDEIGRWYADLVRGAIVLHGAAEMPLFLQVTGPERLRQMDMSGAAIVSKVNYDLTSDGRLLPTDLERLFVTGEVLIGPEGPALRECLTGRVFPVETSEDYPALASAVASARLDYATPLLVNLEARITQPPLGLAPQFPGLTVLHFNAALPGEPCTRPEPAADLTNTYWRFNTLTGEAVPHLPNVREPHLILRLDPAGYVATVGCNRLLGRYEISGDALSFDPSASTLMACPPPLDVAERALRAVLKNTCCHRITGQRLELLDAAGTSLAMLEAVYFR
ncbi:MAG: YbaY family lipoprotein [Paracoccaceae bacterium]